jgi:Arc/MetJ-type ribon-helix-helix transcriptional regulator
MERLTINMPDELRQEIERQRAKVGVEDGDMPSASAWARQAIRQRIENEDNQPVKA